MFTRNLLCSLAAALMLTGCTSGPPPVVRNSDLLRELFYPPVVPRGEVGPDTRGERFDHAAYAALLNQIVRTNGLVDYAAVKRLEPELNLYLVDLGNVGLDTLTRHEQLALLINAYNAFTLKMIAENPGIASPTDIPASRGWTRPTWVIDRTAISLEELEHTLIRARFREARVHFALVHGARGSPPLRREPYTGDRLLQQLDDQAHLMLSNPRYFDWQPVHTTLRISAIFDRYRSDFADDEPGLARALAPWMPAAAERTLQSGKLFRIDYIPFDWKLNGTW